VFPLCCTQQVVSCFLLVFVCSLWVVSRGLAAATAGALRTTTAAGWCQPACTLASMSHAAQAWSLERCCLSLLARRQCSSCLLGPVTAACIHTQACQQLWQGALSAWSTGLCLGLCINLWIYVVCHQCRMGGRVCQHLLQLWTVPESVCLAQHTAQELLLSCSWPTAWQVCEQCGC
jgi:hypothetical protein